MAKEYPLIRLPTQPARLTLFEVLAFCGLLLGVFLGIFLGHYFFEMTGAIVGAVFGGFLGIAIGILPKHFGQEQICKEMQQCSNEELKAKLEHHTWTFCQTLALLNLHLRGEDVQPYLPRVLKLLESNDHTTRLFGRDALALVYTPLAKELCDLDYNPCASTEDCHSKVTKLQEKLG